MIRPAPALLLCCVAVAARAQSRPGDAAAALAARHRAWLGGAALDAVTDVTATGAVELRGLRGTVRLLATRVGWRRTDTELGTLRERAVVGPDGAFQHNLSGQIEPMPAEARARNQAETARLFGRHLTADGGVALTRQADATRDGRSYAVLQVDHGQGVVVDLLLDPEAGSLAFTRERGEHDEVTWTRFSDWRVVDGVRVAFQLDVERGRPEDQAHVQWQSVRFNTKVAATEFARPASRPGLLTFPDGVTSTGWLPMQLYLDRYIYLQATVNGRVTDVVLDSGAGATVVDAALADELGLRSVGQVSARGVGGVQSASFLAGVEIRLGNLTLRGIQAVKLDLSGVGRMLGRPMPVILGKEMFHAAVVDVDYPAARIAFHAPEGFTYRGPGHTVPLVAGGDGHRHVEVTVEDGPAGLCTIDTGSGATLSLFNAFCDQHQLLTGRTPVSETQSGGVGGKITSRIGTLRSVTFAGYRLEQVPATFGSDRKGGAFDTDRLAGNLGAGIFARFRLVFDYRREVLHVEPGPDWQRQPFRKDRVGLAAEWQDGALVVRFVPPGSPLARAGLKVGDRIQSLGDEAVAADRWRTTVRAHTNVPAGTEVRVTLASGQQLRVVAADYY